MQRRTQVLIQTLRGMKGLIRPDRNQQEEDLDLVPNWTQDAEKVLSDRRKQLLQRATETCRVGTVREWLRENSESDAFSQLVDVFDFLKQHIDVEETKNHGDSVHITFWAHGSIGPPLVPARWLLPLPSVTDVVLYSPWNCVTVADVTYGVATGKIRPQHRAFYCRTHKGCDVPDKRHRPEKLPDRWNSLKEARGWKIPTITVDPLEPQEDAWKRLKHLTQSHGRPGRNRILIPFVLPGRGAVPFSVVTLALSLVLVQSRFNATVHLAACLRDATGELKVHQDYLRQQYAFAVDHTAMEVVLS